MRIEIFLFQDQRIFAADHWLLRKSDFNPDSVLVRSVPDADKAGPSGIFVAQYLIDDDDNIGTTVRDSDEREDKTIEAGATEKADNTTLLADLAEDCAEDEWSCHLKGKHRFCCLHSSLKQSTSSPLHT